MDLVHAVEADAHVLPLIYESHQLFDRAIELADDVLNREHHPQREASVDDGRGGQHGDEDVLQFVDAQRAGLLVLSQRKGLHVHVEEIGLHVFPLPSLALFAALQFNLLHPGDELIDDVAVDALLLKHPVVQHAPLF